MPQGSRSSAPVSISHCSNCGTKCLQTSSARQGGGGEKKKSKKRRLYFSLTFNNLYCPLSGGFPSQGPAARLIFLRAGNALKPSSCPISPPSANSEKPRKVQKAQHRRKRHRKRQPWMLGSGRLLRSWLQTLHPSRLPWLPALPHGVSRAAPVIFQH